MSEKKYKVGMYGGKFMPMHKGHLKCLDTAARECELVHLIIFINGIQEEEIKKQYPEDKDLQIAERVSQCMRVAAQYPNVWVNIIDVSKCKLPDGSVMRLILLVLIRMLYIDVQTPNARNLILVQQW